MHKYNAVAGMLGISAFILNIYGISTTYFSTFTLGSSRFAQSDIDYVAGLWDRRFNSELYETHDEGYCADANVHTRLCSSVKAARTYAVFAVILSFLEGLVALVAEHLKMDNDGRIGRRLAVAFGALAGVCSMIVFSIWQGSISGELEDELRDKYYDDITESIGYSQVFVIVAWLLSWIGAGTAYLIPND